MRNSLATVVFDGRTYVICEPDRWLLQRAADALDRVSERPACLDFAAIPEWSASIIAAAVGTLDPPWLDLPAADGVKLFVAILEAWRAAGLFDEVPMAKLLGQVVRQAGLAAQFFWGELPQSPRDPAAARTAFAAALNCVTAEAAMMPDSPESANEPEGDEIMHGPGFRWVRWGVTTFDFTPTQAAFVEVLWNSRRAGNRFLTFVQIAELIGYGRDFRYTFKGHPAKGVLICKFGRDGVGLHESIVV
ncbi:MAG: hypothetical protein JNM18_18125 [Planctomycetaceae bacterium]|nr:hypothetical protein [Planctomycetaceae bacterium]